MGFSKMILLLTTAIPAHFVAAGHTLTDNYTTANFNSEFHHFTDEDPTRGFVQYVDEPTAIKNGLKNTDSEFIYLAVDSTNVATPPGRQSDA